MMGLPLSRLILFIRGDVGKTAFLLCGFLSRARFEEV
jgi:hypothetical protein